MNRFLTFACGALFALGVFADDGTPRIIVKSESTITPLVELYTSEGCSSCPPADELLSRLGKGSGDGYRVVPLAFHVDYWNWLGWEDPYSQARFTRRQRHIAALNQQRTIYTPEIVVSGKEARGINLANYIEQSNSRQSPVDITLEAFAADHETLQTNFQVVGKSDIDRGEVYVALFENNIVRNIGRGENKGKTLTHDYVVRYWSRPYILVNGRLQKMLTIDLPEDADVGNLGAAVVVLDPGTGGTLQSVATGLGGIFPPGA